MVQPGTGDGVFVGDYASDPRLRGLLGPGGPFELEEIEIDGVAVRSFVRAPATLVDVFQLAKNHEDKVHLVFEEDRLTFGDVRRQALSVAQRLKSEFDIGQGDRVVLAMRNFPEFVTAFWAATVLGAIVVPLNAWWTGAELHGAIRDAEAKIVFADDERIERLASVDRGTAPVPVAGVRTRESARPGDVLFEDLAEGCPLDEAELALVGPDDVATIMYTSGTSGRPKGVASSSRATIVNIMNMMFMSLRDSLISGRNPVPATQPGTVMVAPLFHVGGVAAIVGGAVSGSKVVLMRKWDVDEGLALVERENVTGFGGVPAIARQILEHPDAPRLKSRISSFSMGGASVPPELPRRALEVFGGSLQLLNGYGLTETTSAMASNVGAEYVARPDSVGRLNPTADLRVEGPDREALPAGEVGELCFRSPQLAKGYWKNPEATRESFVGGWFRSGDLGYIDEDGFVHVVDRLKDVVIRGGENVYCAEVEAVLFEHPAVADVAVVGLPDRAMGERVCAVVVPRPGRAPDLAELREFALARLAAFKCPEALYLTDDVPRTATGKITKRELRERLASGGERVLRMEGKAAEMTEGETR